ncbi:single-strand DNA-binding protein [Entomoplasma freundtii]|uniref:Single-stranded DNA-binding protein n=1 Tax=Entomoplasma freundtii TaxID=74700 RepID=A0A2K8NSF9_9MOLU|nr:single-stranded DNA-binding protein [Entomoplasma freundtii]ATZ16707.1 single-strand DNA-binding protein [Entomoplasma freundtii]TDY58126.1 single-strand DNA-binding protein [Entomoplasma freundtii]
MNAVSLVGRITQDLVLRETQGGADGPSKFVFFTVATSEFANGNETTNFVPCVAWGHTAENMTKFLHKGSMIGVTGRITVRSKQENGQYQTIVNVRADRVEFLESKNATHNASANVAYNSSPSQSFNPKDPFANTPNFEPLRSDNIVQPITNDNNSLNNSTTLPNKNDEVMSDIDDSILWD